MFGNETCKVISYDFTLRIIAAARIARPLERRQIYNPLCKSRRLSHRSNKKVEQMQMPIKASVKSWIQFSPTLLSTTLLYKFAMAIESNYSESEL